MGIYVLMRTDKGESDKHERVGLGTTGYKGDNYTEIQALTHREECRLYVYIVSNNNPIFLNMDTGMRGTCLEIITISVSI